MKKILSLLLCVTICLGMLSGCSFNISEVMKDRAACFAEGKDIGEPILVGADEAMMAMLDQYNGSLYIPDLYILPDDYQGDPDAPVFTVGCDDDLMKALAEAYFHTWEDVNIEWENNYLADSTEDERNAVIERVHNQIRRADPLHASGIRSWGWKETCIKIDYYCDPDIMIDRHTETMRLVKEKANEIRKVATTEYEQIFEVNRLLCNEVRYPGKDEKPYKPVTHTPYGALNNHVAVCDGYTTAAMLILRELGIECDYQVGTGITTVAVTEDNAEKAPEIQTQRGPHAWNLVCVDHRWYQMDITWNDTEQSLYRYFLVTDAFMAQNHEWDYSQYPETPLLRYHP